MAIPMWRKHFQLTVAAVVAAVLLMAGCSPKVYLSSCADDSFQFATVRNLVVVLESDRGQNPLFGEIFMQSALEKRRPFLLQREYVLHEDISGEGPWERADAFLVISLLYSRQGTQASYSQTALGVFAKLVETATGKTVWRMNYAYKSPEAAPSAPLIEEVMKVAADKLLDCVPLVKGAAFLPAAAEPRRDARALPVKTDVPTETEVAPSPKLTAKKATAPAQSLPVEIPKAKPAPPSLSVTRAEEGQMSAPRVLVGHAVVFSVQAGAFHMKDYAEERISLLTEKGFSPHMVERLDSGKRLWHIVHVGRYATRGEAEAAAKTISDTVGIATTVSLN